MKKQTFGFALLAMLLTTTSAMAAEHEVAQLDKTFVTGGSKVEEMTIAVGDSINFVNKDPFFHNIFSLSDLSTFDLGSFPQGESRSVTFDKPGTIEIECAIHPEMYMEVTVE